jgi:hypothetical protein
MPHCWMKRVKAKPVASETGAATGITAGGAATLEPAQGEEEGPVVSTLDIIAGRDGELPQFTLFIHAAGDSTLPASSTSSAEGALPKHKLGWQEWVAAVQQLQHRHGRHLTLAAVCILPHAGGRGEPRRTSGMLLDAVDGYVDIHGAWLSSTSLPPGSVVLVRPDGHVAWRYMPGSAQGLQERAGAQGGTAIGDDAGLAAEMLDWVLRRVLGGE